MLLKKILSNFNYSIINGDTNINITDVVYDSRKAIENCVFVCLKGFDTDGHKYIDMAISKGACAVVISDDVKINNSNITVIKTCDTRLALAYMSADFFENPANQLKTVALTGTKGKTTTVSMISSILNNSGIKTGTIGTLGIVIEDKIYKTNNTTPESYEIQKAMRKMVDSGCKCMVIEASSLGLKWHRTSGFTYDIGVFTNFSCDHIGASEHANMEEYLECKSRLFKQCKTGIINIDDSNANAIVKDCTCSIETYGFTENADIVAYNENLIYKPNYLGVSFDVKGKLNIKGVSVPIPGKFSVYNALCAISVATHFNITIEDIINGLNKSSVKGRVEPVKTPFDYTLLIDYAHNAVSMENVLTTLREYKPSRLITLFGAGGNRPKGRRFEMGEISGKLSDLSIITEDNSRFEDVMDIIEDIKVGITKTQGEYIVIPNRIDAIRYCIENGKKGDIIVLAGKGHEDYQEIKGVKHHLDEREVIADILIKK